MIAKNNNSINFFNSYNNSLTELNLTTLTNFYNNTIFFNESDYEASFASLFVPKEDRLLLYLRYYARHFIPIFCIVGIIGNCMALLLIRYLNFFKLRINFNLF